MAMQLKGGAPQIDSLTLCQRFAKDKANLHNKDDDQRRHNYSVPLSSSPPLTVINAIVVHHNCTGTVA